MQPDNHDASFSDDDAAPAVRSLRMVDDAWESRECGSEAFLDFLTPCAACFVQRRRTARRHRLDVEKGRRECAGWMRVTGIGAGIDSRVAGRARAPPANRHDHGEDLRKATSRMMHNPEAPSISVDNRTAGSVE